MILCFGRLPHDPIKIAAAPQHVFAATLPPARLDRSSWDYQPHLASNDKIGDCTCAGLANVASGIAALCGYSLNVDERKVVSFYAAVVGAPDDLDALEQTHGAQMADVLNHMQQHGFDIGPQVLAGQWGTLALNRPSLALGMARLGPIYLGVTLRERDIDAFTAGRPWDVQQGRDDGEVVSGHAVIAYDYAGLGDGNTVRIGTWGIWQSATWGWLSSRLDEAHGVTFPSLRRADGSMFAGYEPGTLGAPLTA
jgi:hypothetical protein